MLGMLQVLASWDCAKEGDQAASWAESASGLECPLRDYSGCEFPLCVLGSRLCFRVWNLTAVLELDYQR